MFLRKRAESGCLDTLVLGTSLNPHIFSDIHSIDMMASCNVLDDRNGHFISGTDNLKCLECENLSSK